LGVTVAAAAVFVTVAGAGAETFPLEMKRLESLTRSPSGTPAGNIIRMTRGQHFTMRAGSVPSGTRILTFGRSRLGQADVFSRVVKKEPEKYNSEHPFRGVAKLGSGQYGFVFDCRDGKSTDYSRLYFDLNHNGDLTDDKVIEGKQPGSRTPADYSAHEFPRVDLTLDVDGTKVNYGFFFMVTSRTMTAGNLLGLRSSTSAEETEEPKEAQKLLYVAARLMPAVYREGKVTLKGESRHLALVDSNANGRFDDLTTVRKSSNGRVYPQSGDMLLVDPEAKAANPPSGVSSAGSPLAALTDIGGSFYELAITPAGDKLTLAPAPIGHVTEANEAFRATVYNDKAVLNISGEKAEPIPLPVGEWRLVSYTIDMTGRWKPGEETGSQQSPSLRKLAGSLVAQGGMVGSSRTRTTRTTAYGYDDAKVVKVNEGETVTLPFGLPFKTIVKAGGPVRGGQTAQLDLSLVGTGGERCGSLMVDGTRPQPPEFTISTPDGDVVEQGRFKWG
jgi:hypothetical protein